MKYFRNLPLFAGLLVATSSLAFAGTTDEKPAACCQVETGSDPFSDLSLYQLDATYTNDSGRAFTLGELRGRPVVLTMFFASCGYACPMLVSDMTQIREKLPADIRDQVAFVLVSFDVKRDTPAALHAYRTERGLNDQWILLHGGHDAVSELAALLGVKYKLENNGMFSHSNLITVLNPEGEIVHQREGLEGGLEETARAVATAANSPE